MHNDLIELGWTEEQWNRINSVVVEEAQKARVAAQLLPVVGPEDPSTVAVPEFRLNTEPNPRQVPPQRLTVNSDPTLFLTTISVNVPLRTRDAQDRDLNAALVMFRRAANFVARLEDALVFNGRPGPNLNRFYLGLGPPNSTNPDPMPNVYRVTGDGRPNGLFSFPGGYGGRSLIDVAATRMRKKGAAPTLSLVGDQLVTSIVRAINSLEASGQLGPFGCALCPFLFEAICAPNTNLALPRDRVLPFLQGPLLRSSTILESRTQRTQDEVGVRNAYGVVVALSANPVELVVARDIDVKYLQTTEEPRLVFRVSERVALRIKETAAIAILEYSP